MRDKNNNQLIDLAADKGMLARGPELVMELIIQSLRKKDLVQLK